MAESNGKHTNIARSPYLFLISLWLVISCAYLQIFSVSPIVDILISKYQISNAEAGFLMGIPPFMIAAFAIIGGIFCDKLGVKKIALFSLILISLAGIGRAASQNITQLLLLTIAMSIGIGIFLPSAPKMIKNIFPSSRIGFAIGIYVTGMCVGPAIGLTWTRHLTVMMGGSESFSFLLYGLASLTVTFLFLLSLKFQSEKICNAAEMRALKDTIGVVIRNKNILIISLIAFMLEYTFYTVTMWFPSALVSRNEDVVIASLIMWTFPAMPFASHYSNTFRRKKVMLTTSIALVVLFLLGMSFLSSGLLWVTTALFGVFINIPFAFLFLLPLDYAKDNQIGSATGIVLTVAYLGGIIGSFFSGIITDLSSTFIASFYVATITVAIGAFFCLLLQKPKGAEGSAATQRSP
jgi:CP family cyanate transporter-like MFS transporter